MKRKTVNGRRHGNFRGGLTLTFEGYIRITAGPDRWRMEHVTVLERKLGRPLLPGHHAHHIDSVPWNNEPDNLVELPHAEHNKLCAQLRRDPNHSRVTISDMTLEQAERLTARGVSIPKHLAECMSWHREGEGKADAPF